MRTSSGAARLVAAVIGAAAGAGAVAAATMIHEPEPCACASVRESTEGELDEIADAATRFWARTGQCPSRAEIEDEIRARELPTHYAGRFALFCDDDATTPDVVVIAPGEDHALGTRDDIIVAPRR